MQETFTKNTSDSAEQTQRAQQLADGLIAYAASRPELHEHIEVLKGIREDIIQGIQPGATKAPDYDPKQAVQHYKELFTGPKSAFEAALDKGSKHDASVQARTQRIAGDLERMRRPKLIDRRGVVLTESDEELMLTDATDIRK